MFRISLSAILTLAAALTASNAWAVTITLGGSGLVQDPTTAAWQLQQNGFVLDVHRENPDSFAYGPPDMSGVTSNGWYGDNPMAGFTLSHAQGQTFGLKSFDILTAYSGEQLYVYRSFSDDFYDFQFLPAFYDAFKISAMKSDGTTVTSTFSPWCADSGDFSFPQPSHLVVFGHFTACSKNRDTVFDWQDFGNEFNSIKSFTVEVLRLDEVWPWVDVYGSDPATLHQSLMGSVVCTEFNAPRYDPFFDIAALCDGSELINDVYSLWSIGAGGLTGPRNDSAFVAIQSISVSPIPIPASLPMLAAGVGLIGFFSRRKNAARSA